jgi:hypothetical protein
MAKATRSERLSQRKRRDRSRQDRWELEGITYSDQTLGPGIVSASPEEVLEAAQRLPPDLDWKSVAAHIVPLFERIRPYPAGSPPRVQAIVAPGVTVGFGIDFGPAFITVSPELIEHWSMSAADLAAHSLANLHAIAGEVSPDEVYRGPLADVEMVALQTHRGIGSVLVLAPTELRRIFGPTPRLFIAPMRDLLIGLPAEADPGLAAWLYDDIASRDPNCLTPRAFVFDGRGVTVEPLEAPRLAA